jgi:4-hydroxybenzoate polyprenyltransferase
MSFFQRLHQYALLMRLHRPIGIYLLLWPTLWALWLAGEGLPEVYLVLVFSAGVILMRSAGCAINDFADREIDGHVQRTRTRPLAVGHIQPTEALAVFGVLSACAFILVLTLNTLTLLLSFVAVLLAALYPFMKRYTHWPQVVLGAAFGWGIPMAFAAQTGTVPTLAWWLFGANLLWTVAYDTMYAMSDRDDDIRIGVKSTAVLFGRADKLIIAILQITVLLLLLLIGVHAGLGGYYYLGLAVGALLFAYQQYLLKDRDATRCFQAFQNNHWFGMAVFIGLFLDYAGQIVGEVL